MVGRSGFWRQPQLRKSDAATAARNGHLISTSTFPRPPRLVIPSCDYVCHPVKSLSILSTPECEANDPVPTSGGLDRPSRRWYHSDEGVGSVGRRRDDVTKGGGRVGSHGMVGGAAAVARRGADPRGPGVLAGAFPAFRRDRSRGPGPAGPCRDAGRAGISLLGGLSPSAVYVVETSEGLVLVDSGLDRDAGLVKSQMAELGLDWRRVRIILLTHVHGDHTGGAEALRTATGAKVYAGAGDAAVLRAGGPREAFFSTFSMPDHDPHPTTVNVALEGGEVIVAGAVRIEAIAAPGHTPGSICYLMHRDGLRVLFAGDVIMMLRGDEEPRTSWASRWAPTRPICRPDIAAMPGQTLASLGRLR